MKIGTLRKKIISTTLRSNRTYILPTKYGLIFGPVMLIQFLVSITFGHPFAYLITFLSISLFVMSSILTNNCLEEIGISGLDNHFYEIEENDSIVLNIEIQNSFVKKEISASLTNQNECSVVIDKTKYALKVDFHALKRGVYRISRVRVSTVYPFGLFRAWRYFDINEEIYVYPKLDSKAIYTDSSNIIAVEQELADHIGLNNDEFLEHKKALETDSWRQIDWKAYSRGMGLLSKVYSESSGEGQILSITQNISEDEIQKLISVLMRMKETGMESSLYIDDKLISSGKSQKHYENCLKRLCRLNINEVIHV